MGKEIPGCRGNRLGSSKYCEGVFNAFSGDVVAEAGAKESEEDCEDEDPGDSKIKIGCDVTILEWNGSEAPDTFELKE